MEHALITNIPELYGLTEKPRDDIKFVNGVNGGASRVCVFRV